MRPTEPDILKAEVVGEWQVLMNLRLPENLHFFSGHFDDFQILPGVVQVHWALNFAKSHFQIPAEKKFSEMSQIKFMFPLQPGEKVDLLLQYSPEIGQLEFLYSREEQKFSSGRIKFEA